MISNQTFDAVVWDMDGLIFDTERLSFLAWQHGAKALGQTIDEPMFIRLIGMNAARIKACLKEWLGSSVDVEELTLEASRRYDELIANGPPLKQGAIDCLRFLKSQSVPQALATSSSRRYAERKLGHHQLLDLFDTLVTGDQVAHGKPDPEPYLTAAQRLGVDPERCIAFEDSVNGIHSAHTAGMFTILVPDMAPHDQSSLSKVKKQFSSLSHALPFLQELFTP
ncbi:HAD family phosphatase [Pelagicoccus sp. SDUM812003]|uniref:HAD family hydrolase n=1 Tax=Pelagicoccus sp. SDUM812003 TaxID=3041267 RepID=UPI00280FE0F7|nr:HAD family phosphatase [Pelagicoccus sp. SDUM812003]MDQ8203084.1 HAD family phosphatase [Pelagicoccus sp. SDUM812003]